MEYVWEGSCHQNKHNMPGDRFFVAQSKECSNLFAGLTADLINGCGRRRAHCLAFFPIVMLFRPYGVLEYITPHYGMLGGLLSSYISSRTRRQSCHFPFLRLPELEAGEGFCFCSFQIIVGSEIRRGEEGKSEKKKKRKRKKIFSFESFVRSLCLPFFLLHPHPILRHDPCRQRVVALFM